MGFMSARSSKSRQLRVPAKTLICCASPVAERPPGFLLSAARPRIPASSPRTKALANRYHADLPNVLTCQRRYRGPAREPCRAWILGGVRLLASNQLFLDIA